MHTKADDRNDPSSDDSGVVAVPGLIPVPSRGKGAPAGDEADTLWQSGVKALGRSWEEWRIGWNRLTSWTRGKIGGVAGSDSDPHPKASPVHKAD